jgi:leucyl-tRNA synthetase
MAERYQPRETEAKWQARWEETGIYRVQADPARPKFYLLTMFPYPSADFLHIGHWFIITPTDALARWRRMRGYDVLFPMGFDAFGLPAENAAIRDNIHPKEYTFRNIEVFRRQFRSMGTMFDWSREIITCEPEFYRWNQWFFLEFYRRGLAYRAYAAVDWCPNCNTTLAREQVLGDDRHCERCGTPIVRRNLNQWFFRITQYAEELLDFSTIDWPESTVAKQRNWIGKSVGVEFEWRVKDHDAGFRVFTTRPDTVFGATFCVLAPEHPLVETITTPERRAEVQAYVAHATRQTEIERQSTERERTGIFTGAHAVHPFTGADVPIYVADYVLATYGTGAIMAVPAHDERDFAFARKYGLPIPVVIAPPGWNGEPLAEAYTGEGTMVNSAPYDGLPSPEAWQRIAGDLEARGVGQQKVQYRLRDWLISRQRYWGTPIPIVHCPACGEVPVPEEQLPVVLPDDVDFRPTGESPLRYHEGFLKTTCPECGGPAERETDTMDTFVDSSWYQYRYLSPHDTEHPFDSAQGKYWLPVDQYTGGPEHAVMHLLYTRFFTKAMRDMGLVEFDEPMLRLFHQGVILGPDAKRMSKTRRNVVLPDPMVEEYGPDAVRLFLMFIGPWDQGGPWNPEGFEGIPRFQQRAWAVVTAPTAVEGRRTADPLASIAVRRRSSAVAEPQSEAERAIRQASHRTLKKVTQELARFGFNTAIASLMEFVNTLTRARRTAVVGTPAWEEARRLLTLMLAPLAPHMAEEMWERLGEPYSVHLHSWPEWDEELAAEESVEIAIQVNGKVRERLVVAAGMASAALEALALQDARVQAALNGKTVRKVIVVPDRLVNVVAN